MNPNTDHTFSENKMIATQAQTGSRFFYMRTAPCPEAEEPLPELR